MPTFLFDEIIFGPVNSRRLGNSLGINLLPVDCKVCNFNCIYCECGWSKVLPEGKLLKAQEIKKALAKKLQVLKTEDTPIDTITFAGNGEPTLHPEFNTIIDFTLRLRNKYYPNAKVAVLSNSTMLENKKVFHSLMKVDMNILKIDSAIESTVQLLNQPVKGFSLAKIKENIKKFKGNFIIQTMFIKGTFGLHEIDNTKKEEIKAWIEMLKELQPKMVMIYTIRRDTPVSSLQKVSEKKLGKIAEKIKKLNIEVTISG